MHVGQSVRDALAMHYCNRVYLAVAALGIDESIIPNITGMILELPLDEVTEFNTCLAASPNRVVVAFVVSCVDCT